MIWRLACIPTLSACDAEREPDHRADAADSSTDAELDTTIDALNAAGRRSMLFPRDWTPAFTGADGAFLHDFSYAGYRYGAEAEHADWPVVSVTTYGADATGQQDASDAILAAVAAVPASGAIIFFPAGTYFLGRVIDIARGNLILRGEGHATRIYMPLSTGNDGATLRIHGRPLNGHDVALTEDAMSRASFVTVANAADLAVGDEIVLGMTVSDAFIAEHGMQAYWGRDGVANTWQVFARRKITAIDNGGTRIRLDVPLRQPLRVRDQASIRKATALVHEVGFEHFDFCNALPNATQALQQNRVAAIEIANTVDAWISDVHSYETNGAHVQSSGIRLDRVHRVTIADSSVGTTQNRGEGGNGYLFEIRQSNEVLVRDCQGADGRHNFIQNSGFGTSGCVFLRIESTGSRALNAGLPLPTSCEFHHSLAAANLIDNSIVNDGWGVGNRRAESSGAGHTGTENVFWNTRGSGRIRSFNFGRGYVIGTLPSVSVVVAQDAIVNQVTGFSDEGTEPVDFTELLGQASELEPQSLYQEQRRLRLQRVLP